MQQLLYLLPILACPIGMGLMMFFMMRGNKKTATTEHAAAETQDQIALLRAENTLLRQQQDRDRRPRDASGTAE